ncbi:MAG: family 78 glycoside hydrolase catalytic domain, partial [Treponema sp.]|nr:family 78 glycoside hydrolase catalytic domain [Treponema sp.]
VIDERKAELENVVNYEVSETFPEKAGKLVDRYSLPIIEKERFSNPIFIHTPKKECVLDFSQNLTGVISFFSNAKRGMEIKLSAGEILQKGCFFRDNYRTAKAEFIYISDGKERTVRPHFTFFGFRYMKVECRENEKDSWRALQENDGFSVFEALHIRSDIDQTGFIKTGNSLVNKLFENALWSEKDNFLDVPTDCPQRDERLGWTGDAQIFSNTALYNMDLLAFFRKWLFDMRAEQKLIDGACPNIVPRIKKGMISEYAASPWADAAVIVPWNTFIHSGNKTFLEEAYDGMKMWLDYEYKRESSLGGEHLIKDGFHFADWLSLDSKDGSPFGATAPLFIASCYYLKNAEIVSKAAKILSKDADVKKYTELYEEIKKAILKKYFDKNGLCKIKTQTALSLAIVFSLSKNIEMEGVRLSKLVKENNGALNTGFVGNAIICHALAESGNVNLAYDLLLREKYPSWLYSVKLGASTIWERWDSVLPDGTIKKEEMNSLNHYSYGSIVSFLYEEVCGIKALDAGFKTIRIKAKIDKRLDFVDCKLQTASGFYEVSWQYEKNDKIKYQITIPFGCTAYFVLDDEETIKLTSGQYIFIS